MATPEELGITPEVLARIQEDAHIAQRLVEQMQPVLSIINSMQPVLSIIDRQRETMETIRQSYAAALSVQPPPQTRAELAALVHQLRSVTPAIPQPQVSQAEAEQALVELMPTTPEETDQVLQSVGEIERGRELRKAVSQFTERIDWGAADELTAWGAPFWSPADYLRSRIGR